MNSFVQYLDQFNVLSPSHAQIYDEYSRSEDRYQFSIETKIEQFLLKLFTDAPRSVIMTGNAGDGKTRLCRVIYEKITGKRMQEWPENGIVDVPFDFGTLRIVKDLSELTDVVISEELHGLQYSMLENHSNRIYYLIAANEGKLTRYLSQHSALNMLSAYVEKRFLDHKQNDEQLHLVNLQDVTSSIYAGKILEEWNREGNWSACESCLKRTNCVIRLNHRRTAVDVVHDRLIEQYRLLDCLGIHITMREILIHLSYVLTGGLTCKSVLNANYKDIEEQAKYAYYDNFYGLNMNDSVRGEMGAIQHFRLLDPGQLSISSIDDYLLNGDISGDQKIVSKHQALFDEEIDMLFGYYRKQIEIYRIQNPDRNTLSIFEQMPRYRRKYYFESEALEHSMREKLVPYLYFYRFIDSLNSGKAIAVIRRELIQGLNHAFAKKLINRSETLLFIVNENLMINESLSIGQVKLTIDEERTDIDYLPSKMYFTINFETQLEVKLPVFEYLLRLAGGGLFVTLKEEVDILISTFKNDLINRSESDEYILQVLGLDPIKGVYSPYQIDI